MTLDEQFAGLVLSLGGVEHDEGDVLLKAMRETGIDIVDTSDTRHVIQFDEAYWTILHPVLERLDGSLFNCDCQWEGEAEIYEGRYELVRDEATGLWGLGPKIEAE